MDARRGTRVLLVIAVTLAVVSQTGCAIFDRVTRNAAGEVAEGHTFGEEIDGTGRYVVFTSDMVDMVAGPQTPGQQRVFRRDLTTDTTLRVDLAGNGALADASAFTAADSVSDGGRYVMFGSQADNLVPGDDNGLADLFVRDLQAGTTTLANVATDGGFSTGFVGNGMLSADGRYVVFQSDASDLVTPAPVPAGRSRFYVRDLVAGTTRLVSSTDLGVYTTRLSADGSTMVFSSSNSLVPGDTGGWDTFVMSIATGAIERVSVSTAGAGDDHAVFKQPFDSAISGDGRYVAFESGGSNLVPGDTNGFPDSFVRDRVAHTTERVSVTSTGVQADNFSADVGDISRDGRIVSFGSYATLTPDDSPDNPDVFVRDRTTGQTTRMSTTTSLTTAGGEGFRSKLSADGRLLLWWTDARNVDGPEPEFEFGTDHLFVRGTVVPTVTSASPASSPRGATTVVTLSGHGFRSDTSASISGDGAAVTATSVLSDSSMKITVAVTAAAATGARTVTVAAPPVGAGGLGTVVTSCAGCLTISP